MPSFYSIGFFGAPNFGDELLCSTVVGFLQETRSPTDLFVMTRSAKATAGYTGLEVEYVEGWAPGPEYIRHLRKHLHASRSDLTLIGGGGLISDHYTWQGAICYFTDVCWGILMGRRHAFIGLGVVGLRRWWLKPLVRFVCRQASSTYVRDEQSAARFHQLAPKAKVEVGPDLASLASLPPQIPHDEESPYALVNFREKPPINEAGLRSLIETLVARIGRVVLLPAEPSDLSYYHHIVEQLPPSISEAVEIAEMGTLDSSIGLIDAAQVVVAERLHVNVVAAQRQKPLLVMEYEDKVGAYMQSVGTGYLSCSLQDISSAHAESLLQLERPDWSNNLAGLRQQARDVLDRTLESALAAPRPGLGARAMAALHLMWLLPLITIRGSLILIKRAIFGRGAIGRKKR